MNNKYKLLFRDTLVFAIGSLGSKIIVFFLVPLYTNFLTKEEYGIADLMATLSTLIIPVASLSIDKAVLRFGMKKNLQKENVLKCSFCILALSIIIVSICIPFLDLYKPASPWKYYLIIQVLISNVSEVEKSYLKVKDKNKQLSIIGILNTAILTALNILLIAVYHTGISGYLISNIVASFICVLIYFFIAGIYKDLIKGKVSKTLLREMTSYSAPLILSGICWCVLHSSDKIMIECMVGPACLGLYTAASKIPSLINVITGIFNQAWGLSTIREYERAKDVHFYALIFNVFGVVLFLAGIVFISICKPFMLIYVGEEFREAWRYTPFLFVSAIYYSIFSFLGSIYIALQKSKNDMWTALLCSVLNIVVNYFGIKAIGTGGAVLGTLISYSVFTVVRIIDLKRYISFNINVRILLVNSLIVVLLSASVTFEKSVLLCILICILVFILNNYKLFHVVLDFFRKRFSSKKNTH